MTLVYVPESGLDCLLCAMAGLHRRTRIRCSRAKPRSLGSSASRKEETCRLPRLPRSRAHMRCILGYMQDSHSQYGTYKTVIARFWPCGTYMVHVRLSRSLGSSASRKGGTCRLLRLPRSRAHTRFVVWYILDSHGQIMVRIRQSRPVHIRQSWPNFGLDFVQGGTCRLSRLPRFRTRTRFATLESS